MMFLEETNDTYIWRPRIYVTYVHLLPRPNIKCITCILQITLQVAGSEIPEKYWLLRS